MQGSNPSPTDAEMALIKEALPSVSPIFAEIFKTEKNYLADLARFSKYIGILLDTYQNIPVDQAAMLVAYKQFVDAILKHPALKQFCDQMAKLKDTKISEDDALGLLKQLALDVHLSMEPQWAILQVYSAAYTPLTVCLKQLESDPKAKEALAAVAAAKTIDGIQLDFSSMAIMPIQRFPRYELLVKDLVKHLPVSDEDKENTSAQSMLLGAFQKFTSKLTHLNALPKYTQRQYAEAVTGLLVGQADSRIQQLLADLRERANKYPTLIQRVQTMQGSQKTVIERLTDIEGILSNFKHVPAIQSIYDNYFKDAENLKAQLKQCRLDLKKLDNMLEDSDQQVVAWQQKIKSTADPKVSMAKQEREAQLAKHYAGFAKYLNDMIPILEMQLLASDGSSSKKFHVLKDKLKEYKNHLAYIHSQNIRKEQQVSAAKQKSEWETLESAGWIKSHNKEIAGVTLSAQRLAKAQPEDEIGLMMDYVMAAMRLKNACTNEKAKQFCDAKLDEVWKKHAYPASLKEIYLFCGHCLSQCKEQSLPELKTFLMNFAKQISAFIQNNQLNSLSVLTDKQYLAIALQLGILKQDMISKMQQQRVLIDACDNLLNQLYKAMPKTMAQAAETQRGAQYGALPDPFKGVIVRVISHRVPPAPPSSPAASASTANKRPVPPPRPAFLQRPPAAPAKPLPPQAPKVPERPLAGHKRPLPATPGGSPTLYPPNTGGVNAGVKSGAPTPLPRPVKKPSSQS